MLWQLSEIESVRGSLVQLRHIRGLSFLFPPPKTEGKGRCFAAAKDGFPPHLAVSFNWEISQKKVTENENKVKLVLLIKQISQFNHDRKLLFFLTFFFFLQPLCEFSFSFLFFSAV